MRTMLLATLLQLAGDVSATVALDGPALLITLVAAAASVLGNVVLVIEVRRVRRFLVESREHMLRLQGELDGLREVLGIKRPPAAAANVNVEGVDGP